MQPAGSRKAEKTEGMDRYAVFGHPISHSRSPDIHARFAAQTRQAMEYRAMDVPAERFETSLKDFIEAGGRGLGNYRLASLAVLMVFAALYISFR